MNKTFFLITIMFGQTLLYGQQVSREPQDNSLPYRVFNIPEVSFFQSLYQDDFIGDTLEIDGKTFFFSQSPMKQFPGYMMGQKDMRLVLVSNPKASTAGMPDKGYVLHFTVKNSQTACVDNATYNGTIYPKSNQLQPMDMNKVARLTGAEAKNGTVTASWLNGCYRINDTQASPSHPYQGKRYIAVFEKGRFIKMYPDTEKENFNPPLVDLSEKPDGISVHDFLTGSIPEYVYYKSADQKYTKEKMETTIQKWSEKLMNTYRKEPFLDRECGKALKNAWLERH